MKVAEELEACTFGITCLTAENVAAPWILFEAGALAKSMQEGMVVPLLLDLNISDITGPLAQFQAKKADKTGLLHVLQAINKIAPTPLADNRLNPLFEEIWPNLEKAIGEIPKATGAAKHTRPQTEILEELVDSVRNLEVRYREMLDDGGLSTRRRRSRMHPMMLREMMHNVGKGPGDPINILMIASYFREDVPWIYELGRTAYNATQSNDPELSREAYERFARALDFVVHGPFMELEMDKGAHMMVRGAMHFLEEYTERREAPQRKTPTRLRKPLPKK